ncbi:hypothetical protein V8E53_013528 [Lactarius tabidus]
MNWSILFFFLYRGFAVAAAAEEYHEELAQHTIPRQRQTLGPLFVLRHTSQYRAKNPKQFRHRRYHYTHFTLALSQSLREHAIPESEFRLTTNPGKWDCNIWAWASERSYGDGWATGPIRGTVSPFLPYESESPLMRLMISIDSHCKALQNELLSLFGASPGSMGTVHATSHTHAFLHPPATSAPPRAKRIHPKKRLTREWLRLVVGVGICAVAVV